MDRRVLIVDDNIEIISFVKPALEVEGYTVDYAVSGDEALQKINLDFDIILLDVTLPDTSGFDICKNIRRKVDCPILFLTARGLEQERIKGFLVGGDDYIVKPFSLKELILRMSVHIRKDKRESSSKKSNELIFGDLRVNILSKSIQINKQIVELTRKEYEIIELLCTHSGQVFSKEQIFEVVWGNISDSNITTVTEHVRRIRLKLHYCGLKKVCIKTVWGLGYKWEC
ncbi:response regulator transcription factor [Bacillus mycoides]|uniref:response regulator transcription factor n=1 Tax=Bacillus TaxID=1386 RepID=UPI001C5BADC4|nr:response regulator transcription factor [Bacillus sp. FDAARGOS_1420]MBW3496130.1 response regulator transcription factor [Bacillus sp. FDAARGOS_1420]